MNQQLSILAAAVVLLQASTGFAKNDNTTPTSSCLAILEQFITVPRPGCEANRRCARHHAALKSEIAALKKVPRQQQDDERRCKLSLVRTSLIGKLNALIKLRAEMTSARRTLQKLRRQNKAQRKRFKQRVAHLKALRTMR